ncbi:Site-specific DNA-methyltransferase (adenine-specific) [Deinococcus proteolyticus MRP]|uniref:site-specific DNA-methyltransferase (adenine-specific) n=1 Tax=Deinococcus proteolyticus (strain ATCC 35074 / DSM 20540 / JCM 6276 / NBRC 101906 / NCIMB 13154 / VKM Ac-1939 / CCM 2703 / MRP) TaxID=693977 RepID=F0RJX9_DEIPM|nr:class I SAM-dependent DNA methyltransferase [Deinococcus proteolyticus]ADY26625.1 Site-specific DNA-methyltransferase (adenine-specific) [Deinococcus proteolyticus MRP]
MTNSTDLSALEKRLWDAADQMRANSKLKSHEYSTPVLGLVFLSYADYRFQNKAEEIGLDADPDDFMAEGVLYVPEKARYSELLKLPEGANIGAAINEAMNAIEAQNPDLTGALPKMYNRLDNSLLAGMLKSFTFSDLTAGLQGDAFGRVFEYFLGEFARNEGSKGGEFYTPQSLVKLMVEIMEPFHGKIYDPACGSGGMFVQSARFVEQHQRSAADDLSVYGQEKTSETARLARMNLAIHGLSGDIKQGNTFYEDLHASPGKFDFAMANPPFNVKGVDKERISNDQKRLPYGTPSTDNANYLWLQYIASSLNSGGRAGVVMANSASDARGSEQLIRQRMIEDGVVDVMVATSSNLFYTVTLPATLWFMDKGKKGTPREDTVLFIDARNTYQQVTRAIRELRDDQVELLANIVNLYRGEADKLDDKHGTAAKMTELFPDGQYRDIAGLCKVATRAEIAAQGWSLNPGRYVGVEARAADDFDFGVRLSELNEELETLTAEAHELEARIGENVRALLERQEGGPA